MNLDIKDNVCRICLKRQDTLFSLYRNVHGASPYQKLVSKTSLRIELNDDGPSSICSQCLIDLDTTVSFLERCERANQALADIAQSGEFNLCSSTKNDNIDKLDEAWVEPAPAARPGPPVAADNPRLDVADAARGGAEVQLGSASAEPLQCRECGSKRRCAHWAPPTSFSCHLCHKTFNKKYNYQIHLKRHLVEREWWCGECGAPQVSESLARRHCRPRVLRRCPVAACHKKFTNNSNLRIHLRSHTGEKPFECHDCGKRFTSKKTLRNHIRIHTGEKPYMCVVCGVRFTSNHLSSHARTHEVAGSAGARVRCPRDGCARGFPSRGALRSHARSHTTHKAFSCALCPATYKYKQSLNRHVRKRHGLVSSLPHPAPPLPHTHTPPRATALTSYE